MRYKLPNDLDTRLRRCLAIFPITIGREVRWLEIVYFVEVYKWDGEAWGWRMSHFIEKADYLTLRGEYLANGGIINHTDKKH